MQSHIRMPRVAQQEISRLQARVTELEEQHEQRDVRMDNLVRLWNNSKRDSSKVETERDSAIDKYEGAQCLLHDLQKRHDKLQTVHHDLQDVVMDLLQERNKLRTLLSPQD